VGLGFFFEPLNYYFTTPPPKSVTLRAGRAHTVGTNDFALRRGVQNRRNVKELGIAVAKLKWLYLLEKIKKVRIATAISFQPINLCMQSIDVKPGTDGVVHVFNLKNPFSLSFAAFR
jgi:hypothetical protein